MHGAKTIQWALAQELIDCLERGRPDLLCPIAAHLACVEQVCGLLLWIMLQARPPLAWAADAGMGAGQRELVVELDDLLIDMGLQRLATIPVGHRE